MRYQDFKILTDLQYSELNNQYSKIFNDNNLNILYSTLTFCKNSLLIMCGQFSQTLSTTLNESCKILESCLESLKILYPKIKAETENISSNLFYVLEQLTSCISNINKIVVVNQNKYYKNTLFKLENNLLSAQQQILNSLSVQQVKIFKHM